MPDEHALLSPSSFERISSCPGSVYLNKSLPDVPPGEAALKGTELHAYSAEGLTRLLKESKPITKLLRDIQEDADREIVKGYIDSCVNLYSDIQRIADKRPRVYIEHRVTLTDHIWGTTDFLIVFEARGQHYLIIKDLKTGKKKADDKQLPIYAASAAETLKIKPKNYYLYTYQPKLYGPTPHRIKMTDVEMEKFLKWVYKIEKKALHILENGAEPEDFKVGSYCFFCKAKVHRKCSAYYGKIFKPYAEVLDDDYGRVPSKTKRAGRKERGDKKTAGTVRKKQTKKRSSSSASKSSAKRVPNSRRNSKSRNKARR